MTSGLSYFQLILLVILQLLLTALQMVGTTPGSDHYYHIGLIKRIRANGHRFVQYHPNMIGEKYFSYPQLYHWILSFLPPKTFDKMFRFVGISIIITLLQLVMFLVFCYTVYPFMKITVGLEDFMLINGLIFVLTPFNFAIWNAKNTGISARGFGLLLGQVYIYIIIWYFFSGNTLFLLFAFVMAFVIMLSSQFTLQFVLFSAPLFALFCWNIFFLFIPIIAMGLFFVLMPNIARSFFMGQIGHKTLYYKYIAEKFILNFRHSIWRDFVYDFWINLKNNYKSGVLYIYNNPLMSILIGMPFFSLSVAYFVLDKRVQALVLNEQDKLYISIPILVCFVIFILTSFRKTRFLGEPARYMEFAIPQISILAIIIFFHNGRLLYVGIGISMILVFFQFFLERIVKKRWGPRISQLLPRLLALMQADDNDQDYSKRIFSNNIDVLKYFIGYDWQVLMINITSPYTGSMHFKDIFPIEYPHVGKEAISPLIEQFDIGWFILDCRFLPDDECQLESDRFRLIDKGAVEQFRVFRVHSKD